MSESQRVRVSTGARLHFGLLSLNRDAARVFGGAGMMIDRPGWKLEFERADGNSDEIIDRRAGSEMARILDYVERYRSSPLGRDLPPVKIHVQAAIPAHQGLGSGTQLGLSIAAGLNALSSLESEPIDELAAAAGRGQRSGLGVHGFEQGGFLVDGGKPVRHEVAPLVTRHPVPEHWRVLLVMPFDVRGLHGDQELQAFEQLSSDRDQTAELCRLLLLQILPSLIERDFDAFAQGIHDYGFAAGEMFAALQGSPISDPTMRELYHQLRSSGITGIGQSSWGPGLWILCRNDAHADEIRQQINADPRWHACRLIVARPYNLGALIEPAAVVADDKFSRTSGN